MNRPRRRVDPKTKEAKPDGKDAPANPRPAPREPRPDNRNSGSRNSGSRNPDGRDPGNRNADNRSTDSRDIGTPELEGSGKALRIIPIGGMGEIGKNMFALEYDEEILLIDGGLAFPDAGMLGVDILVPRIDYLVENAARIKGWVLTHGHEDHIGGIPYMLKLLPKIPMYGAKLTLGLLRGKFEEFRLKESDADLREISTDERIKLSKYFTVDFFRMTHSIPDNSGLIIHTPIGRIVHSGDFKLDYHPADGKTSHLHKLAQAGQEGVLVLISDSTNAERPGYTPSERDVSNAVEQIVAGAKGRVIVTTFASHVHRLQNFIRIAEKYDRRVIIEGRSMIKNTRIAQELGYLEVKQPLVGSDEMTNLADDKVLFLCTGSQGQPMAALSRLASGTHRKISLQTGDTVILSSNPIPGNEEAVGRVINELYGKGVSVFYPPTYRVHASGHASQEELKLILDLTRPKFFLPWHGEVRHQINHQRLAESMATPPQKIVIAENGDVLELSRNDLKKVGQIDAGVVLIDSVGKVGEEVSEPVIRDRQTLSSEGVVVIMALAGKTPSVEVITRGVSQNHRELGGEVEKIALEALKRGVREKRTLSDIRDDIFYPVRRHLRKATGRNPLIVPTVIES